MSLNAHIVTVSPPGELWLYWDADPKAECYRMIAPDGTVHQVGKKQTRVRLGKPAQPFTVSIASAYPVPSTMETITYPHTPPPPPQKPTIPKHGMSLGGEQIDTNAVSLLTREFDWIAEAGAKLVRFDCWPGGEERTDRAVTLAHQRGLAVMVIVGGWLRAPMPGGPWYDFVNRTVDRYYRQGVRFFVTSNEPNNGTSFTPKTYAAASLVTAAAVHQEPDALIGIGELSLPATDMRNWVKVMYEQEGIAGLFDAVSTHCYDDPAEVDGDWNGWSITFGRGRYYTAAGTNIRSIMNAHGDDNVDIWITEAGGPVPKYSLAKQAAIVHNGQSDPGPKTVCHYTIDEHSVVGYGLVDDAGNKRPAFTAYQQAAA